MPLIYFVRKSDNRKEMFFAEMMTRRKSQGDILTEQGESSSNTALNLGETFISRYEKLPDHIKSCLDFCCVVCKGHSVEKDKLVRLLLAERLIPERTGEIMEDRAEKIVEELISMDMLLELYPRSTLQVHGPCRKFCLVKMDEQDFFAQAANLPVRAIIKDDGKNIPPDFKSLQIHSLFLTTAERRGCSFDSGGGGLSREYMQTICKLESLIVLDLNGRIEYLPDGVGHLVHLRYLGLRGSDLHQLPRTLGNLQKLKTLDIRMCGKVDEMPIEILNIQQLRHLLLSKSIGDCEVRVPKGIGTLANLHTCTGVYAGGGIANELSTLTQLREFGAKRVSEDHASELSAAIMNMENLVSLSLEAEGFICDGTDILPEMELFSPPSLLQKLHLLGGLVEMPSWLASMESLTTLSLSFSNMLESPTSVLQFLPNLKHLDLWEAYKAKYIGKEFCRAGGFPKLETLKIASGCLVEWSEIVDGAFPSLRHLRFRNCLRLKFLPEGLQNISTLEELWLLPSYNDISRRLKGEENYKIKHIKNFFVFEISQLREL